MKEKVKFVKKWLFQSALFAPEIRLASSLSCLEFLSVLYYGKFIKFTQNNPFDENRDRFIISKGHGSICMYPIFADIGYFDIKELEKISKKGSFLGSIPDPMIPGYETINGSLGHGLGVGCGLALSFKTKNKNNKTFVLCGNGELQEGSCWEAIMFAAHYKLDNLILLLDNNKVQMLDFSNKIIDIEPFGEKFKAFGWDVFEIIDGHNLDEIQKVYKNALSSDSKKPKVIIANTIKGKGTSLEGQMLSHVMTLKSDELESLIKELENE